MTSAKARSFTRVDQFRTYLTKKAAMYRAELLTADTYNDWDQDGIELSNAIKSINQFMLCEEMFRDYRYLKQRQRNAFALVVSLELMRSMRLKKYHVRARLIYLA